MIIRKSRLQWRDKKQLFTSSLRGNFVAVAISRDSADGVMKEKVVLSYRLRRRLPRHNGIAVVPRNDERGTMTGKRDYHADARNDG